MGDFGSYVWFFGLGGGIVALGLAYVYATNRRQKPGGDPNAAWKEAAAEAGHPEVAHPETAPRR